MMKKIGILLGIVLMFSVTPVYAACSLGATPLSVSAKAKPGNIVEVTWNLYNMYGDRSTHVNVTLSGTEGWEYTITPALYDYTFSISGTERSVTANMFLLPKPAVDVYPGIIATGEDFIQHPFNQNTYIPVSTVKILITVPGDAEIYQTKTLQAIAKGMCFGETTGTLQTQVSTQLDITIETVSVEYYEELILELPWYIEYLPIIITLSVLVMLLALLYFKPHMWKKLKGTKSKRR